MSLVYQMNQLLYVGLGGFIGAVLRFLVSGFFQRWGTFPLGTFMVNVSGSFLLGFVMCLVEYKGMFDPATRVFLTIGLLGAFTTISTFSYDSLKLLESNEIALFCVNVLGTVLLTILSVYLGRLLALNIFGT